MDKNPLSFLEEENTRKTTSLQSGSTASFRLMARTRQGWQPQMRG